MSNIAPIAPVAQYIAQLGKIRLYDVSLLMTKRDG